MKFKADEIASVIQQEIEQYRVADRRPRSRPRAGSRRRHRPRLRPVGRHGRRDGRVPQRRPSAWRSTSKRTRVGVIILGDYLTINEGDEVRSTGQLLSVPVGDALLGRVVDPLGNPLDGKGPIVTTERRPVEFIAPGVAERQPVKRAAADRHQGHRRDDAHRPRPARADHRRPQDRQDRHRHRHDHQSEGLRREVLLRRDRPEGIDRGRRDRSAAQTRRDGLHHRRSWPGPAIRPRCSTSPPTPAAPMAEYFMYQGRARPDRLRRPVEAGRGLSPAVAADAASAGPRGVSRATCSTATAACWSGRPSSATNSAAAR